MWVKKQQLELDMKQGTGFRLGEECDKGLYCRACVRAKFLQSCPTLCNFMAPLSMGFSRQEYWSGLPYPPPEDLPNPGIELKSFESPALADEVFSTSTTWEDQRSLYMPAKASSALSKESPQDHLK